MNKFLLKALVLASVNIAIFADAQFRTRNRMDKLEDFDQQTFSWGFYLNGNRLDYRIVLDPRYGMFENHNLVKSTESYSFGAGLIAKFRLNDYLDVRLEPGLQFAQRQLTFNTQTNDIYRDGSLTNAPFIPIALQDKDRIRDIKSTLVDVPVLLEFHGDRWYNSRPYVAAGVNYIVNLQSNSDSQDDNLQQTFRSTTHNFAWSAEMGIQFYFNKFKLTPAIRGTFFMNNEMVADNPTTPPYWSAAISTLQTRAIMFVLKFE
ncbi:MULTISPECIES: type IX secretion/gliding motility protein PorT/SprT [Chryseobacterium]|uniref:type IX secretion/gliding motility protein PorT/SprT n=1 Tax=Chryseobacterium TaxID=59732 RepID=UPI00117F9ED2|nr:MULTISPECIES: porin family protein [Chryseobacterium]MXS70235.1 outer membrane beta-barrel protein [Flavobacteriaceae bacterium W22]